jgi:hypothetical protein
MTSRSHKAKSAKKSAGTRLAEQMRAEGNKLTDHQREKLGEEFMKLYYGGQSQAGNKSSPLMPISSLT